MKENTKVLLGKGRLNFKRLKQLHDLISFRNYSIYQHAYFCIAFKDNRWDKSDIYMIPIIFFKGVIDQQIGFFNKASFKFLIK